MQKSKTILLVISLSGVKVCSSNGEVSHDQKSTGNLYIAPDKVHVFNHNLFIFFLFVHKIYFVGTHKKCLAVFSWRNKNIFLIFSLIWSYVLSQCQLCSPISSSELT